MKQDIATMAVIGTGLAGMLQALALANAGLEVTLIGPQPTLERDDRTTAVWSPGIAFLHSLGLWEKMAPSATKLVTMEVIDGAVHSVFDAAEIECAVFGYNISNAVLKQTLADLLQKNKRIFWHQENARTLIPAENGWTVTLSSGKKIAATLLIGADGRQSKTRQAAGIPIDEKTIDQSALVGLLQSEKPHYNVTGEWLRPAGPLTLVPVEKNKLALVWCDKSDHLAQKIKLPPTHLAEELNALTARHFGTLKSIGKFQLWPVQPMRARQLVAQGCALIGEAAHVLPPIGAQGFNTTLQDIKVLTEILAENKTLGLPMGDAAQLARYQGKRLPDITLRYHGSNALNALLLHDHPALAWARRFSLGRLGKMNFLKKHLMQVGLGRQMSEKVS